MNKDKALIEKILKGDIRCMEKLYKEYYGFARALCLRYSKSNEDADEICNDAFLTAFNKLSSLVDRNAFKSWFGTILIRTAIDRFRENRDSFDAETSLLPEYHKEDNSISEITFNEILEIIRRLPQNQQIVFNLYEIEGYSHAEISKLMGIAESSSRVFLARAKETLRRLINKTDPVDYAKTN